MKVKIKRFCKRVLPVAISVMVLAAAFCIPVSAAGSGWSQLEFSGSSALPADDRPMIITYQNGAPRGSDEFYPYTISTAGQLGSRYTIGTHSWLATSGGQMNCFRIPVNYGAFEVQAGDVIRIEFTDLYFYFYDSRCEFFVPFLGLSYDNRTFFIQQVDPNNHPSKTGTTYSFRSLVFEYTAEVSTTITISYFLYSFTTPSTSAGTFSADLDFVPRGVVVSSSGNPASPEYPKYDTPDGGFIEDYTEKEEEVLNSTQGGQDEFNSLLANFRTVMEKFGPSMLAATWVFNLLLDEFALSYFLLYFALLTGVAAFVLGVAAWIGRGSRSSSSGSKGSKGKKGG